MLALRVDAALSPSYELHQESFSSSGFALFDWLDGAIAGHRASWVDEQVDGHDALDLRGH